MRSDDYTEICEKSVRMWIQFSKLKNYFWDLNKVIVDYERLGESCGQWIFGSECFGFGGTKKKRYTVVMVKPEDFDIPFVWSAKVFLSLRLKCGKGQGKREVAVM